MSKPLGLEYLGKHKWFTYEMFSHMKWEQSESVQNHCSDDKEDKLSWGNKSESNNIEKNEEHKSLLNESVLSNGSSETEPKIVNKQNEIAALRAEFIEFKNDFKTWMEKVIVPLNIIANCIMQNQGLQNNPLNHEELASDININENANQCNIVIHQIEDPNIFRKKYPYETFIVEELPELDSKLKKDYSNWLKLAYNIEPLAFFLYKNPQLDIKTMKSYVSTVREYY